MKKAILKGRAKEIQGGIQYASGKLSGSRQQKIKGISKFLKGRTQRNIGKVMSSLGF